MFAHAGYVTRGRKRSFLSPSQLGGDSNIAIDILIHYFVITSNELRNMWGEVYISLTLRSYSAYVRGWGSGLTCLYGDWLDGVSHQVYTELVCELIWQQSVPRISRNWNG